MPLFHLDLVRELGYHHKGIRLAMKEQGLAQPGTIVAERIYLVPRQRSSEN